MMMMTTMMCWVTGQQACGAPLMQSYQPACQRARNCRAGKKPRRLADRAAEHHSGKETSIACCSRTAWCHTTVVAPLLTLPLSPAHR
jgi:hypothetical protein